MGVNERGLSPRHREGYLCRAREPCLPGICGAEGQTLPSHPAGLLPGLLPLRRPAAPHSSEGKDLVVWAPRSFKEQNTSCRSARNRASPGKKEVQNRGGKDSVGCQGLWRNTRGAGAEALAEPRLKGLLEAGTGSRDHVGTDKDLVREPRGAMSLDSQGTSVKSMVNAYESHWGSQGCGCCLLPDAADPHRHRQRGCTSPALSRDASPARTRPRDTPRCHRKLGGRKKEVDKTLVSLLLVLHSGTNSSMIAIDNKIEQAMDLVKSHLMFAVREEVEVLREQIKELSERNALLEQENALLRSLASTEQLSRFQAQLHATTVAKPPPSGTT
uniref:Uncharacterized protein n=2 Tax=Sphaerodactylus townsendi TaxID=933632 RepID=A0ACB8EXE6_9SAUR